MQFIKEKSFYKTLVALALPIALQDLIKFGLNLMDNVMVGAVSETALSGVSLANQPFFMFSMLCFGLAGGGAVLITQYYGKKDMATVRKVVSMTLSITIAFSVLIGAAVLLFPEFFMRIFTDKEELIPVGVEYLRIVGWTYFLYGISNTLVLVLRSVQVVKVTLLANAMAFVLNVFLNWVLIFGKLGMPALGVRGAAIATLTARFVEFLFLLVYIPVSYTHLHEKKPGSCIPGFFHIFVTKLQNLSPFLHKIKKNKKGGRTMSVVTITKKNFQKEVLQAKQPVLLDFWAEWCGPCQMLSPVVEEVARQVKDVKIGKINVDEEQELAMQFRVMSIPTLAYIKNGTVVEKSVGLKSKEGILDLMGK